ncbi:MAG: M36 family metallopeptidase [Kofleriaceae bacterium]
MVPRQFGLAILLSWACNSPTESPPDTKRPASPVDSQHGKARFVWARDPAPAGLALTEAARQRGATTLVGAAALAHADRNAARWGLSKAALSTVYVANVIDSGRGSVVVRLRQRIAGIDVAQTHLSIVMNRDLSLIALSGGLHAAATPTARVAVAPAVSSRAAIDRAFDALQQPRLAVAFTRTDPAGFERFAPGPGTNLVGNARVKRALFPVNGTLVDAWVTEVATRDPGRKIVAMHQVFAANDGKLLFKKDLTADAAFSYRVWAESAGEKRFLDSPQGDTSPHPTGAPNNFDAPFVAPALVSVDSLNTKNDPWLPAGATVTTGNNVDAYLDIDGQNGFSGGDLRPTTTSAGSFDRAYNPNAEPDSSTNQRMAAATHLFYVNNFLHDYFYDSGFDEAAGNAQASNLGRGGVENDVLLAEGQDSSGTNNANMFTPADGESPRMQMFTFSAPAGGAARDGTIDTGIISHEWGHYFHHRLVECGSTECASMSEGWGDFIAMLSSVRTTDNLNGAYPMGSYAMRSFSTNASYFGIRRYPYSTDFTKNPLTFRMVQRGVALPAGPPITDVDFLQGIDNWEVHTSGEVWCAMLWEGLADILKDAKGAGSRYSFDEGRRRFADYIVAGMAAAPVEPTYIEQRDAILAAAAAADPVDFGIIARAFARRGFGTGAVAPAVDSDDGSGVIESFDTKGLLAVTASLVDSESCDDDGLLDQGETGTLTVRVQNLGAETLAGTTVRATTTTEGVEFPDGGDADVGEIPPGEVRTAEIIVKLGAAYTPASDLEIEVVTTDSSAAVTNINRVVRAHGESDIEPASSATDTFNDDPFVWIVSPASFERELDDEGNGVAAVTLAAGIDATMQTPLLTLTGPLSITFKHRYGFDAQFVSDGAVIEISTDGGATFVDVTDVGATPDYTGVVVDFGEPQPLAGRMAYTGKNPSFPAYDTETLTFPASITGQVAIRFRAVAPFFASRWELDSVAFSGISTTPFPSPIAESEDCVIEPPPNPDDEDDDGGGCCGASSDPRGALVLFGMVALVGLRRRRR